jgi:hypothetical protein
MNLLHNGFLSALDILADQSITASALYETWWSGPRSSQFTTAVDTSFHEEIQSRFLFSVGSHEIHTVGHQALELAPGDFYNSTSGRALIKRRREWSVDHFTWRQGKQPNIYPFTANTIRVYVPSHSEGIRSIADEIANELDSSRVPFQLKYRREVQVYRDSIVLWVDEHFVHQVNKVVQFACATSEALATPPPLTLHVGPAGYTEQMSDGSSPGWTFSTLLWTISKLPQSIDIPEYITAKGFDPEHPWRFTSSQPSFWESALK